MKNVLERILNLLAFLLTTGRPVTAAEIQTTVAGYDRSSPEAFHRMFERDKDLLRRLGIPLRTAPTDRWEVEAGYEIPPDQYRLPDPDLTDEERAALWLAAQVVRIGGRPSGPEAILKLGGARTTSGVEPLTADLGADADRLADLFAAITERRRVRFVYHDRVRSVEPHGLGHRRGHWYLVGVESDAERVYRLDRMGGLAIGETADAFHKRPGLTVDGAMASHPWEAGGGSVVEVTVVFDPEAAWWAAKRLGDVTGRVEREDGSLEVTLEVRHMDAFLGWVLSFGAAAEVVSPEVVRAKIVARILAVSA